MNPFTAKLRACDAHDKFKEREHPSGFDQAQRASIEEGAGQLASFIEATFRDCTTEQYFPQDASYVVRLIVFHTDREARAPLIEVVFSAFGRMVSVTPYDNRKASKDEHQKIIAFLEARDFVYIPRDILDSPYEGKYNYSAAFTWWNRFFSEL